MGFLQQNFEGLIERVFSLKDVEGFVGSKKNITPESKIVDLFEKIVSLKPEPNQPILDCGADSVVIVEFVDQIETKFSVSLEIEDDTTLRDIIGQLKSS